MSNTVLTDTKVTREALRILHQKLNFIGSINRQYDDSFAKSGAKIGTTLKIREPNQYTVRTGATLNVQDTAETSQALTVATQKGVDVNFTSVDLTMSLDDFGERILEPAMSVLAANIEYDAMAMYKDVYNAIWTPGSALAYNDVLDGRVLMQRGLAPTGSRTANLNSQDMVDLIQDTKTLFNDQGQLSKGFREGYIGRAAGYEFMENTLWPGHTCGSENGSYVVNTSTGITSGTATITTTGGSGTMAVGDVFTVVGVNSVHPETKVDTGVLQQFVVTEAASGAGAWAVSPTPITSGAKRNIVINSDGAGKTVVVAGTASGADTTSLLYHKDAFTFVTADLDVPKGMDFARREVLDGISMRIVRGYDINNDQFPCRIDVLYGHKTLRPQWATRLHFN
jgi:hypothetical protein